MKKEGRRFSNEEREEEQRQKREVSIPGVTVGLPPTVAPYAQHRDGVGVPGLRPLDTISPACSSCPPANVAGLVPRRGRVEGIANATEDRKRQIASGRECARVSSVCPRIIRSFLLSSTIRFSFRFSIRLRSVSVRPIGGRRSSSDDAEPNRLHEVARVIGSRIRLRHARASSKTHQPI